ncbi:MAG TPA: glycosyltransferase family 4 protein [Candidatus Blautia merdipullorum]|nr:glycosyltransferase family 4 protein [Candidatus Blautia merdipullorum]
MKILLTTDWYKPVVNGVVTSVINLKKELESRGHEVRVLTLSRSYESYAENGVYYIKSLNLEKIYPNARAVLPHMEPFVRELIWWNPDVVHSQCEFMTFSYALKISKKCQCPLIHTYHTVYEDYIHYLPGGLSNYKTGAKLERKAVACFSKMILSRTSQVIVPTKKVENILKKYGVGEPVSVMPTGVDLSRFKEPITLEEKNAVKKRLGIPLENKVLVSVGRLAKEKNLEELLEYFAKLVREGNGKNLTFLIAGDGPDRERLEKLAEELGIKDQVVFTGMISPDKVAGYYKLGDVFVCASNSETQGITYIEALACGLPALCRRDDCLSQVVTDGYNGFQYENYAYFKIHLDYILEQEERRLEMGRRGQEISSLYSTWNFCTAAEGIYRKVIERQEKYRDGELSREEKNTETKNRWKEIPASWARVIMKRGA